MEGIRELLDGGADPNFRDSDGRTTLHIAAWEGFAEVVELLLQRGAEEAVGTRSGGWALWARAPGVGVSREEGRR